jgi:type I restriction enzyme, R subunit
VRLSGDALGVNDRAVQVLGEPTLRTLGRAITATVCRNVTIDWAVRAQLRFKRIFRTYGYPPDKQEYAAQMVLAPAAGLFHDWAVA